MQQILPLVEPSHLFLWKTGGAVRISDRSEAAAANEEEEDEDDVFDPYGRAIEGNEQATAQPATRGFVI